MLKQDLHPTDQELVRAADGELSRYRAGQIRDHLAACWACRSRCAALEGTIVDLTRAWRESPDLPPIGGPIARLSTELNAIDSSSRRSFLDRLLPFPIAMQAGLFALTLTIAAFLFLAPRRAPSRPVSSEIPDRMLTPGYARDISLNEACSIPHERVMAEVTPALRQKVLAEYGITSAPPEDYEIDYLIAPGLGGTDAIQNLWPEPYQASEWNAHVKDALEEQLHAMVCAHDIDLRTAQRAISSDWIAAYKLYFHTDRPLPNQAEDDDSAPRRPPQLAAVVPGL
jgi:hypothetical protein